MPIRSFVRKIQVKMTWKHLNDNWYEVNYTSAKGSQYERAVSIPVRVVNVDGQYLIDDITPEN